MGKESSKMPILADGVRLRSRAVFIPQNATSIGVQVPDLDDAAAVYLEVGDQIDGNLWTVYGLTEKEFPEKMPKIDSNLKAYYTFDGNLNTDALLDRLDDPVLKGELTSGRNQTLTKNGNPTKASANASYGMSIQHGDGIVLDGTGDYLTLAYELGNAFDITTQDFTVMITFRLAATTSKMVLLSKRAGAASDGVGYELGVYNGATSEVYAVLEDADSTTTHLGKTLVDEDDIHTVFWSFDRDGLAKTYLATGCAPAGAVIDIAADAAGTDISGEALTLATTSDVASIGADNASTPANLFTGVIYNIAIWHDLLTLDEMNAIVRGGFAPVIDPVDGNDLEVCGSGDCPGYMDITAYVGGCQGRAIRCFLGAAQTTTPIERSFDFYFK